MIGQGYRQKFNYVAIAYNHLNLREIILKKTWEITLVQKFLSIKWIDQNIGTT